MAQFRKKGFTLIELIIGITILALLAVGLLAALDPAEQFAKARDTSTRNTLLELYGALQRYEASQETYPGTISTTLTNGDGGAMRTTDQNGSTYNYGDAIGGLITAGELKANFKNAAGTTQDKIFIFRQEAAVPDNAATEKIMLCYRPTSKSFKLQAGLYTLPAGTTYTETDLGVVAPSQTGACATAGTDLATRDVCVYCAQ